MHITGLANFSGNPKAEAEVKSDLCKKKKRQKNRKKGSKIITRDFCFFSSSLYFYGNKSRVRVFGAGHNKDLCPVWSQKHKYDAPKSGQPKNTKKKPKHQETRPEQKVKKGIKAENFIPVWWYFRAKTFHFCWWAGAEVA